MSAPTHRPRRSVVRLGLAIALAAGLIAAASALAAAGDLGPQQRVSSAGPGGDTEFEADYPALVHNPDRNEYLAVWEAETSTDGEYEIFGRLLGPGGTPIGGQFQISDVGPDGDTSFAASSAAAAYNPTAEEYLVTWAGDDDTGMLVDDEIEVFAQRLSATGTEVGPDDLRISAMGPDGDPSYVAVNSTVTYSSTADEYLVAWRGDDDAGALVDDEFEIYAQRLTATGVEVGTDDQRVSMMGPDGSTSYAGFGPTATHNPVTGEYLIGWFGTDDAGDLSQGESEIYVQRLSDGGAEVGTDDQRVSMMGPDGIPSYDATSPSATYNLAANQYLLAWRGTDDDPALSPSEREIYVQCISAAGVEVGTDDQRISTMGPDGDSSFSATAPSATSDPIANEYLIAWHGDDDTPPLVDNEFEAFAQRLTASGAEVGADDQRISRMGPDGDTDFDAFSSTVAFNPVANEYLIAWTGDDDTAPLVDDEYEIFARSLEAPPPPSAPPSPGPGPTTPTTPDADPDTEVTDPDVTIAKKLKIKGKELKVKVSAGAQENVTSRGRATVVIKRKRKGKGKTKTTDLKPVTKPTEGGERTILRLKYRGGKKKRQRQTRKLVRSIKKGKKARVRVQVTLTDEAGNSTTEKRVSRLKVERKKGGGKRRDISRSSEKKGRSTT